MEYHALFIPAADKSGEDKVFTNKIDALNELKNHKDARFKSFKSKSDAFKFARNGFTNISVVEALKSPSSQPSLEKSIFKAPKSQDLVKFRKEIENNNLQMVHEIIWQNPRYLVSNGDTPSILKEGTRYNALHVAAIAKHAKMAKLILQTIEQIQFIELLHNRKDDSTNEEVSLFLLESYLNTPDKSRNETPLHFAAKFGAIDVIEVLISYPLCKMQMNAEGLYPKDIICQRNPSASSETITAIENLLKERFFVPVLRSSDQSVPPLIGEPFTPNNMPPKSPKDPLSPTMEIKAYAGPMDKEQAQTFRRRWKTPPRLIPSPQTNSGNLNLSFSPKSSQYSSPTHSPRHSKSMTESLTPFVSSTPKMAKKKLFDGAEQSSESPLETPQLNLNFNGAENNGFNFEEENHVDDSVEFTEIFHGYRNPSPIIDSPMPVVMKKSHQNNSNSNSGKMNSSMVFLDESGSVYSSENLVDSPSFREKHIRLTDTEKGLEVIGRSLAHDQNIGWKEYWQFLGTFVDIRSDDGLSRFEGFLKSKEKTLELNEKNLSPGKKRTVEDPLAAICSSLYSLDINREIVESSKSDKVPASPTSTISAMSLINEFMLNNKDLGNNLTCESIDPYLIIEKSCNIYANRLVKIFAKNDLQNQLEYEKTLLAESKKLNSLLESYMRDQRFSDINYQKIHALYSFFFAGHLMTNDSNLLRNKILALATQFCKENTGDASKSHAYCLSSYIIKFIEKRNNGFADEKGKNDVSAWNNPELSECKCLFEVSSRFGGNRASYRRDIRKKLWDNNDKKKVDLWGLRNIPASDDESDDDKNETYLSCESTDSENEEFFTPPSSPTMLDRMEFDDFEESLEEFEEKIFTLFIEGEEPSKTDFDVLNALGNELLIDETQYPLVSKWYKHMKTINAKSKEISIKNRFRIFTPKLKCK